MSGEQGPGGTLQRLYRDAIRRHSTDPVGYRLAIGATHRHEEYNPQCGDRIEMKLRIRGGNVEAAAFDGEACAICLASASLLCSLAPGRSAGELRALGEELQEALKVPVGAASAAMGSDREPLLQPLLQPLLGVRPYPSRVRCATLPWTAARRAMAAEPGGGDVS